MNGRMRVLTLAGALVALVSASAGRALPSCRNPNFVRGTSYVIQASATDPVRVRWYGHSFFEITSGGGTVVITDPFGSMGYPIPEVWPHVVTVGREHGNHNNVGLANGDPMVLRGLKSNYTEWNNINFTYRDVLIYNVPVHMRGYSGYRESLMGSAFVFEMNGMCILHAGDVSESFNEDQLQLAGRIDVLMVPIGGTYTAGPEEARRIVEQLRPKIVIPMHYWQQRGTLESFINGPYPVRFVGSDSFTVSSDTLPRDTVIYVLEVGAGSGM
jgi:L-ascorbate metabolism protein UlaG (beta-lactamase superfamily)